MRAEQHGWRSMNEAIMFYSNFKQKQTVTSTRLSFTWIMQNDKGASACHQHAQKPKYLIENN